MYHLREVLGRPLNIIHIDAHRDDAIFPGQKPTVFDQESLIELLEETRISDFFDSLSKTNTLRRLDKITESKNFSEFFCRANDPAKKSPPRYDLLSLDIDIFGPEGDFVDLGQKVKVIAQAWQISDVICIVTSPGFIDQEFSKEITKILINNLVIPAYARPRSGKPRAKPCNPLDTGSSPA